jgi:hypothetical protein
MCRRWSHKVPIQHNKHFGQSILRRVEFQKAPHDDHILPPCTNCGESDMWKRRNAYKLGTKFKQDYIDDDKLFNRFI